MMPKFNSLSKIAKVYERKLFHCQLNLTSRCMCRCQTCRKYEWPREELNFATLKKALLEMKEEGLETALLTGGDPYSYSQINNLIEFLIENDIAYNVFTALCFSFTSNAKSLNFRDSLMKTANRVFVSVDSADMGEESALRGISEGMCKLVKSNILQINLERIQNGLAPIRINSVLSSTYFSRDGVHAMVKYARDTMSNVHFSLCHTHPQYMLTKKSMDLLPGILSALWRQDLEEYGESNNNCNELAEQLLTPAFNRFDGPCEISHHNLVINSDGSVFPCCVLVQDNAKWDGQISYAYGKYTNMKDALEKRHRVLPCTHSLYNLCKDCNKFYGSTNSELRSIRNEFQCNTPVSI